MSLGPIPASAATAYGMESKENIGAMSQCSEPKSGSVTPNTSGSSNENNSAMTQMSDEGTSMPVKSGSDMGGSSEY